MSTPQPEAMPVVPELLPCPFCGAKAATYFAFPISATPWHINIEHGETCPFAGLGSHCYESPGAAAEAWNTRPAHSVPREASEARAWRAHAARLQQQLDAAILLNPPDFLDQVSTALDEIGAPRKSPDGSMFYGMIDRIKAIAPRPAPPEGEGLTYADGIEAAAEAAMAVWASDGPTDMVYATKALFQAEIVAAIRALASPREGEG